MLSIILVTASFFVDLEIRHPFVMMTFMILIPVSFCLFGFILGIWADWLGEADDRSGAGHHAAHLSRRHLLLDRHVAARLAVDEDAVMEQRCETNQGAHGERDPARDFGQERAWIQDSIGCVIGGRRKMAGRKRSTKSSRTNIENTHPMQNGTAESVVGFVRRESLDSERLTRFQPHPHNREQSEPAGV
jgi:hypothetical protein